MTARAFLLGIACLGAAALSGAPARAQSPSSEEAVRSVLGTWEISNADRDKTCTVTFKNENGAGGLKLDLDKPCSGNFPQMKEVVAWSIGTNDVVRLVDRHGKPVLEFSEVESGMYEAERPGEGLFFMQSPAAAGPPEATAEQMTGTWTFARNAGKPICTLTLTNSPARDGLALTLAPGCDGTISQFAPSAWEMDRGELVLKSPRGQTWRFEQTDATTWQRVPESIDPLLLTKK
ncbi:MAG TPA: AprI/Inh family metalloprotease inhibitor [Xanthobacteraceae bacterium]|jgi:hypothetical protein|nr:AprI/Inh family metalloprotease inhibitor [Xanthobacteraceae bacterium]